MAETSGYSAKGDDPKAPLPTDILEFIIPAEDAGESAEREKYMADVSIEDNNEYDDAVIVASPKAKKRKTSMGLMPSPLMPDAPRICSAEDAKSLEHWWGIGPGTPDRRMEAAMPGHFAVSSVEEVMVRKTDTVENLLDGLPLDELCAEGEKYILWQIKLGKACLLSLHHVADNDVYEKVLKDGGDALLQNKLKLIVVPINLVVSVPVKGPKDADTMGAFFGKKNTSFFRSDKSKFDIATISVDLYSVWSLRMLLPQVAFKTGRIADFHLVSYDDNAVLASYRAAMTPEVTDLLQTLS